MRAPALLRRKEIWLPTPFGALGLLLICASALVLAGRHAYPFLAPNEPLHARLLVIEGWLPRSALEQALPLCGNGRYERILATGGPIESEFGPLTASTYAERARLWLEEHGVPPGLVVAVPGPGPDRGRTYRTALAVRQWLTPLDYDPTRWWSTSAGTKNVVEEAIAWTWTELFFWPGAPETP